MKTQTSKITNGSMTLAFTICFVLCAMFLLSQPATAQSSWICSGISAPSDTTPAAAKDPILEFYRQGQRYMEAQNFNDAVKSFCQGLKLFEQGQKSSAVRRANLLYQTGKSYYILGANQDNRKQLEMAIQVFDFTKNYGEPAFCEYYMGMAYLKLGDKKEAKKRLVNAVKMLQEIGSQNSCDTISWAAVYATELFYTSGELNEAARILEDSFNCPSEEFLDQRMNLLSKVSLQRGEKDKFTRIQIEIYEKNAGKSTKNKKVYEKILFKSAKMLFDQNAFEYTLELIDILVKKGYEGDTTEFWTLKGDAHYQRKQYDLALEAYEKAAQKASVGRATPEVSYKIGMTFFQKKDYESAKKNLLPACDGLQEKQQRSTCFYTLAMAHLENGEIPKQDYIIAAREGNLSDQDLTAYNLKLNMVSSTNVVATADIVTDIDTGENKNTTFPTEDTLQTTVADPGKTGTFASNNKIIQEPASVDKTKPGCESSFKLGRTKYQLGKFDEAIKAYNKCSNNPANLFGLIQVYYEMGNSKQARKNLKKFEKLLANKGAAASVEDRFYMGNAYMILGGLDKAKEKYEEAITSLGTDTKRTKLKSNLEYNLGIVLYQSHSPNVAMDRFEASIESCENNYNPHFAEVIYLLDRGQYKEAVDYLTELKKKVAPAKEQPDTGLEQKGQQKENDQQQKTGKEEKYIFSNAKEDATFHYLMGRAKIGLGQFEGAFLEFDKSVKLEPEEIMYLSWREYTRYYMKYARRRTKWPDEFNVEISYEKIITELERAIALEKAPVASAKEDLGVARYFLAYLYYESGDMYETKKQLEQYLQLGTGNTEHTNKAKFLLRNIWESGFSKNIYDWWTKAPPELFTPWWSFLRKWVFWVCLVAALVSLGMAFFKDFSQDSKADETKQENWWNVDIRVKRLIVIAIISLAIIGMPKIKAINFNFPNVSLEMSSPEANDLVVFPLSMTPIADMTSNQ